MAGKTLVHVTHEVAGKIGGIGAVLEGFFTSRSYLDSVNRSILVGPFFTTEVKASGRLGRGGEILYSGLDNIDNTGFAEAFHKIEKSYNAGIIYGRKTFIDEQTGVTSSPEVLLIDVRDMLKQPVDDFKSKLYREFGIHCDHYEHLWEFEQYIRTAPPAIEALKVIGAAKEQTTVMAHEFMGMPTTLAAIIEPDFDCKTVFYAHEVAAIRRIVEEHPGHDTMFYNAINSAKREGLYINEVFGDQSSYFKHPLVESSKFCDSIFAVGDYASDEILFLAPELKNVDINVVYNGIPAYRITVEEKLTSRERLRKYCRNLLDYRPDVIFTHVTRLITSKGLWRDLKVLNALEKKFRATGKTGIMFLLSTQVGQKPEGDIRNMESAYDWPVAHREGWPDLSGGEAEFYTAVQKFNSRARNIKVVFINQFGFDPVDCGNKMPDDIELIDIRKGTDVEFGQSVYEPFGISQLEPLTFGGLCVISNVCGCLGFVNDLTAGNIPDNIIVADYTGLEAPVGKDIENMLLIDGKLRDRIETAQSKKVAEEILARLPEDNSGLEKLINDGYELAKQMCWDRIINNYLLPSLKGAKSGRSIEFLSSC